MPQGHKTVLQSMLTVVVHGGFVLSGACLPCFCVDDFLFEVGVALVAGLDGVGDGLEGGEDVFFLCGFGDGVGAFVEGQS